MPRHYDMNSKSSVLDYAKRLTGKRLRDLLNPISIRHIELIERSKGNKGRFGHKVETYYFEYDINCSQAYDFPCGLELKVTPLKALQNGRLSPKERLVCNIINFHDIVHETWESSSFLKKNNELLIMRYVDPIDKRISQLDYKFVDVRILNISSGSDHAQFREDWNKIVNKIMDGKAHELSESDTKYLGACTKGSTKVASMKSQPFSNKLAMQRAFSLKTQYMSILLERHPEIYKVWRS